jgi:putative DNA primase/helicase
VWAKPEDFDRDDDLLCVRNGYVNLRTGEFERHDRGRMMTRMCGADYRPGLESNRFVDFLYEIFGGDHDLVEYVLAIIGYSLTGSVAEEVFFILHGVGKNGKSKLIEALLHVFSGYSKSTASSLLLRQKQRGIPNDIARLQNVRLVVANETAKGDELDEARVKEITGGDQVSARFLNKEFFDFSPKFKLWLRTNHLPEIPDGGEGIWRRILTIPFNVEIPETKRDKNILEKLKADADAILSLGVRYAMQWYAMGLKTPKVVADEVGKYRGQMDHFASWLTECCYVNRENAGLTERSSRLHASYLLWTVQNEVPFKYRVKKNLVSKELVTRKFERSHDVRGSLYHGIQLREHEVRRLEVEEQEEQYPGVPVDQDGRF